ncbi:MAG: glycoside hydrolase family 2 TIM barrel-domain containing protein [Candidatus Limnocylindrales bacterium]
MTQRLPDTWLLEMDPDNAGRAGHWFDEPQLEARPAPVPGIIQQVFPGFHGVAWYWTRFEAERLPAASQRAVLHFGAVDYLADVWLNGVAVGGYEGGETPFELDVTEALHAGENLVAVRVVNPANERIDGLVLAEIPHRNKRVPLRSGNALNSGGILYPVELAIVDDLRVVDVFAQPDSTTGRIALLVTVKSDRPTAATVQLGSTVAPASGGAAIAAASASVVCPPGETVHEAELRVSGPRPWSLDSPYLYRVTVALDGAEHAIRCGFRDFRVEDGYFRLNGERVFLKSTHTGNHTPIGQQVAVVPDHVRRDIILAKAAGFNCVRFIAGVAWPEQLDFCDEIGMLVYEECYAAWCLGDSPGMPERFDRSTSAMIRRDRNHPSVAIWGLLNETRDGPVFRQAVAFLPKLRALDPTRLVLLASGRWDAQPSIGSVSNPGGMEWEHAWGVEAPGAPAVSSAWSPEAAGHVAHAGDAHAYPTVPQGCDVDRFLRTLGADSKPVFLSEYGIGSLMNVTREARRFEQAGARPDLEDAAFLRRQAEDFAADWERLGFGDVYPFAEDLFTESYRLSARQRTLGFDCIRSNPHLAGYNLTGMLDHGLSGEGLWTFWREWKPAVFDAVADGWSPLRWCLFADPMHGYSGGEVTLEAVLANEGVIAPGIYPAGFRVLGPEGFSWEQHADVRVDGQLAVPGIRETIRLDGPSGVYTFAADLERGGAPAGGRLRFHLSREAELPQVSARFSAWGLDPEPQRWLASHGVACVPFTGDGPAAPARPILVGTPSGEDRTPEAWDALRRRIADGATALFLDPGIFRHGDDTTHWLPLEKKGRLHDTADFLYHKECVARRHPVFDGLPGPGILDWDFYGSLIPHRDFDELETPAETVAAAFATGHVANPTGYHCGLLLAAWPLGDGRIILNTFPVLENLARNPAADRLLLNMLAWLADGRSRGSLAR